jgi:hypothetical protein
MAAFAKGVLLSNFYSENCLAGGGGGQLLNFAPKIGLLKNNL